jgi:hypothetical protein
MHMNESFLFSETCASKKNILHIFEATVCIRWITFKVQGLGL